jgi:hypothetical protein
MKRDCARYSEALADLAEGKSSPEMQIHVDSCQDCRKELAQLQKLLNVTKFQVFKAPVSLVSSAQAIMQVKVNRLQQVRCLLLGVGARSGKSGMQATYGGSELSVNVVYQPVPTGWEIVGRAPEGYQWVTVSDETLPIEPDGYFALRVKALESAEIRFSGNAGELYLPPVEVPVDGNGTR